jgi:DME family drug/metabolite transporter
MSVHTSVHPSARRRAVGLLVVSGIFWGTGGFAGILLSERAGLAPVAIATHRLLIGGGLLLVLAGLCGEKFGWRPSRAIAVRAGCAGVLLAVFQAAYFAAAEATSVGLSTLTVMVSVTVMVTLGTALVERRPVPARAATAVVIAVLGLVLLVGSGAGGGRRVEGAVLALVSSAGFAVLTLDRRELPGEIGRITFTGLGFLAGGALLLPAGLTAGLTVPLHLDTLGILFYLGLVPTALAYAAFFTGLQAGPRAGVVAVLSEPLTAALLGTLLLAERLSTEQWGGAILVLGAIVVQAWPVREAALS